MNKFDRIQAAINRLPVDRIPYAFWRHFPEVDRNPVALAQTTLRFHDRYGCDFLKMSPRAGYAVEDWGCMESDIVMPDGHRPCARHAVNGSDDWKKIKPLDIVGSAYGQEIEALIRIVVDRRTDAPVVPTVFSPLTLARKLSGDRLNQDLRERPEAVVDALEAISETLLRFVNLCLDEEAAGIFYAIQAASRRFHTEEEYLRFGEPYDRRILEAAMARAHLVIIHAHGDELMSDQLARLPAHAWNWDSRNAPPTLREGKAKVPGAVIGGLNQFETFKKGRDPEEAQAEANDAIDQTEGIGLIIAPGCVIPPDSSDKTLIELAKSLGGTVQLRGIPPS